MSQSVIFPQIPNTVQGAVEAQRSLGSLISSSWIKESDKVRPYVEKFINIFSENDNDVAVAIEQFGVTYYGFNFQPFVAGTTSLLTYANARRSGITKGVLGAAIAYSSYYAYNIFSSDSEPELTPTSSNALTLTTCPNPVYRPDDVFYYQPSAKPKLVVDNYVGKSPSMINVPYKSVGEAVTMKKIDGYPLLLGALILLLAANAN